MSIFENEIEQIYFSKTRDYFKEVTSSYEQGNYRSAVVMLYSVLICDIVFKLEELRDMNNDNVAKEILENMENNRNNPNKSYWEKILIENVNDKTELFDTPAHNNIKHLQDDRNLSAHPVLNDNYELFSPNKETVIAHIKNILDGVLIKPPIFTKAMMEEIIKDITDFKNAGRYDYDFYKMALNNRYFNKMSSVLKERTFKDLWKLTFISENDDAKKHRKELSYTLEVLCNNIGNSVYTLVKDNNSKYRVSENESSLCYSINFISKFPDTYKNLDEITRTQISTFIYSYNGEASRCILISWFLFDNLDKHMEFINDNIKNVTLTSELIVRTYNKYVDNGKIDDILLLFIKLFGVSWNYDTADVRFKNLIEPYLPYFKEIHFKKYIEVSNKNNQIYDRRATLNTNAIVLYHLEKNHYSIDDFNLGENFKYSKERLKEGEQITDFI